MNTDAEHTAKSKLGDYLVARAIVGHLWSEVRHTSGPYFGDWSESAALRGLALLFTLLGEDTEDEYRTIFELEKRGD